MGNAQSCFVVSLSLVSTYLLYVHVYRAHRALKSNVLRSDKLPSLVYLCVRYVSGAIGRRSGRLYAAAGRSEEVVYTLLDCRLQSPALRRFCAAAGYGWDYPDSEHRDLPLCFPEVLFRRLMLVLLTDTNFRLRPAGLTRVRQSLKTFQPVDELKKGPFTLQVRVLEYRQSAAGPEVDVRLSAASRSGHPVWESVLTLLSRNRLQRRSEQSDELPEDRPHPGSVKQVELRVPGTVGLQRPRSFSDFSPWRLLGFGPQTPPRLWMLSVCLAEIEKHKGVGVITAPVSVDVQFKGRPTGPGKVTVKFWETTRNGGLSFVVEQRGRGASHLVGLISRS